MDTLELKRHYERLSDDEIMRVWADKGGISEVAFSVLSDELKKRGLLDAPSQARITELRTELTRNRRRFRRGQRRIVRRFSIPVLVLVAGLIIAALLWLTRAIH